MKKKNTPLASFPGLVKEVGRAVVIYTSPPNTTPLIRLGEQRTLCTYIILYYINVYTIEG